MFETASDQPCIVVGASTTSLPQAKDWSLVLLSQGIESVLDQDPQGNGWRLMVPSHQRELTSLTLGLYERENRAWPFRHPLPWSGFSFDWTVLAWALLVLGAFLLQMRPGSGLEDAGICNAGLVRTGEWWRPVTATMLHADPGHLTMNVVFGLLLLGVAMGRFGSGLTLLGATLAGSLANLIPLIWRPDTSSSLGASGVVMGALGMMAAGAAMHYWQRRHPPRLIMEALVGCMMLFVLVGLSPTSDVTAHAGGFAAGLAIGFPLAAVPVTSLRRMRVNFIAGALFCLLMTTAWTAALHQSGNWKLLTLR